MPAAASPSFLIAILVACEGGATRPAGEASKLTQGGGVDSQAFSRDGLQLLPSDPSEWADFGDQVSMGGDLDGDGLPDLAVGAPYAMDDVWPSGAVYVYSGWDGGGASVSELKVSASHPYSYGHYGSAITTQGDLDGDGLHDLLVGAHGRDNPEQNAGIVYLYRGALGGIDPSAEISISASNPGEWHAFGIALSSGGDIDGDGLDDLAVGAPGSTSGSPADQPRCGSVYVYMNATGDLSGSVEQEVRASDCGMDDEYGSAVASEGDLDGDGYSDLVVGALYVSDIKKMDEHGSGRAYVYLGGAGGVSVDSEQKIVPSDGADFDAFGTALATGGDLDGDGNDDLVVGAPFDDDMGSSSGAVYVYMGSTTGVDLTSETKLTDPTGGEKYVYGYSLAPLRDLNGDGLADLLVGSPRFDGRTENNGAVLLYLGTPAGVAPLADQVLEPDPGQKLEGFGYSIYAGADLHGDGNLDIAVGAPHYDTDLYDSGAAYLFSLCDDCDRDGFTSEADCDDNDPTIHPGAEDIAGDGIDQDCNGEDAIAVDDTGTTPDGGGEGDGGTTGDGGESDGGESGDSGESGESGESGDGGNSGDGGDSGGGKAGCAVLDGGGLLLAFSALSAIVGRIGARRRDGSGPSGTPGL